MMRKLSVILLIAMVLSVLAVSMPPKEIEMDIYVNDPCGGCGNVGIGCKSCTVIDEIANRYRLMFPESEVKMHFYNLRMDNTLEAVMKERITDFGVDPKLVPQPVLFIEDKLFLADGSMDEALKDFVNTGVYPGIDAMLREKAEYEASRVPGRVVYLYSSYCEDCKEISKWLTYSMPLGYEVVKYDIYTEAGMEMEKYYREALAIPEEEYVIPMIVYGDYWFAGKDSIYLSLKSRMEEYPDLQTTIFEEVP